MGQAPTKKMMNSSEKDPKLGSKEKNFIHNGAILLQKQITLRQGQDIGAGQLKIFSIKDIEKATNCYEPDLIVGSARATIYKGTLGDRVVAIKAAPEHELNPELIDLFLTEASTGSVMNYGNMVTLYGCCLETYVPVLVYKFLPNGRLFEHLHGGVSFVKSLKWDDRLKIVSHISYALSYMHNALPKPVVHRDVQSCNILLDDSFNAESSNFGHSFATTPGDTSQRWPVRGTLGYIDPEYIKTGEVIHKCDVYSFGILMLELLTGRLPLGKDLVQLFVSAVEKNCTMEIIDEEVLEEGSRDDIHQFAHLALRCVARRGMERPTMIEVVGELWQIQGRDSKRVRSHSDSQVIGDSSCTF